MNLFPMQQSPVVKGMFAGRTSLFDKRPTYSTPPIVPSDAFLSMDMSPVYRQAETERAPFGGVNNTGPVIEPNAPQINIGPLDGGSVPTVPKPHNGFFSKDGAWRDVLGTVFDGLASAGGRQGLYWPQKMQNQQWQHEADKQRAAWEHDAAVRKEERDYKANQPQYFGSGNDRVKYDPVTGQSTLIYDAPTPFQEYADILGLEPGTDEYNLAMQDFVLRANGPTAQEGREDLEGLRQDNRVNLEGIRQGNRLSLRQTPTYANLHPRPTSEGGGIGGARPPRNPGNVMAPILDKVSKGQPLSAGEQQLFGMYQSTRGGKKGLLGSLGGGGVVSVNSVEEARALPKGTRFRTPDGKLKVR